MALLALTASSVITWQWQSTQRLQEIVEVSQAMGLAREVLAIQRLGAVPNRADFETRLVKISSELTLTLGGIRGGVEIGHTARGQASPLSSHPYIQILPAP